MEPLGFIWHKNWSWVYVVLNLLLVCEIDKPITQINGIDKYLLLLRKQKENTNADYQFYLPIFKKVIHLIKLIILFYFSFLGWLINFINVSFEKKMDDSDKIDVFVVFFLFGRDTKHSLLILPILWICLTLWLFFWKLENCWNLWTILKRRKKDYTFY